MDSSEQINENLLKWSKVACEEERARVGFDPDEDTFVPSWLPELEAAILDCECGPAELHPSDARIRASME